ncbi:MAG: hypothetical protein ABJA67_00765 [Chthonomonadales bacterium]
MISTSKSEIIEDHPLYSIVKAPVGTFLEMRAPWHPDMNAAIVANNIKGIDISSEFAENLDFLYAFPQMELLLLTLYHEVNCKAIHRLINLRNVSVIGNHQIEADLSALSKLEDYTSYAGGPPKGIENCKALRKLHIQGFKASDLSILKDLTNLEFVRIDGGSLVSLGGIENCHMLDMLWLSYQYKLSDISAMEMLPSLREIEMQSCKKVATLRSFATLPKLKSLVLAGTGEMDTVRYFEGNTTLERFIFVEGSFVRDGDFSPLLAIPSLVDTSIQGKPHYLQSRRELRRDIV